MTHFRRNPRTAQIEFRINFQNILDFNHHVKLTLTETRGPKGKRNTLYFPSSILVPRLYGP